MKIKVMGPHPEGWLELDRRVSSWGHCIAKGKRYSFCAETKDAVVLMDMNLAEAERLSLCILDDIKEWEDALCLKLEEREARRNRERPRSKWVDTATPQLL